MLNRSQIYTLFAVNERSYEGKSGLPFLPNEMLMKISDAEDEPDSEISQLLHLIAYGDLSAVKTMLDNNPRLVLMAGDAVTPSGLKVMHAAPLECALGAGDPEMAEMIKPYFDKFEGGATIRAEQLNRYRQHIEEMLEQTVYDFSIIMIALKEASYADVRAELLGDENYSSYLRDALNQFRQDFATKTVRVGMHFNYDNVLEALRQFSLNYWQLDDEEDEELEEGEEYLKRQLFCQQILGLIQLNFPATERMMSAQGAYRYNLSKKLKRSLDFDNSDEKFTDKNSDIPVAGLGFNRYAGSYGLCFDMLIGDTALKLETTYKSIFKRKQQELLAVCKVEMKIEKQPEYCESQAPMAFGVPF